MMSALPKDVNISLKVMMNKQKTKVLFAEADSKFVEIVLSFLKLPLGEIVRVLEEHYVDEKPVVGSLNTLFMGLTKTDSVDFWTDGGKKMLLSPRTSFMNAPVQHFRCGDIDCNKENIPNASMYYDSAICDCGKPLNRAMAEIKPKSEAVGDGILVEGLHFLVTDDLQLAPYQPGSLIQTLVNLGIVVTEEAETWDVTLEYNEIVDLLKGSLLSKTPLTDTILHVSNENWDYLFAKMEPGPEPSPELELEPEPTNSKRMTVTALIQKSTNEVLWVNAKEDFVDFIFSFLTIPLGGVESLLRGKTCVKSIDNLYNSAANHIKDEHYITKDVKTRLHKPEFPPYYISKNQIFAFSEQTVPPIYYYESIADSSDRAVEKGFWMRYKDPKGDQECYVRPGRFRIYDNLAIFKKCKFCQDSNVLSVMAVPLSDVKEMELQIGLKEGLSILKAALTSTTALTYSLFKYITTASVASDSAENDGLHDQTSKKRLKTK